MHPHLLRGGCVVVGLAVASLSLVACGRSSSSQASADAPSTSSLPAVIPVGVSPSEQAKMVCEPEAATDIATGIGVHTTHPPTATWADHTYTCRYPYSNGTMVLSVKELSRESETTAYFNGLEASLGRLSTLQIGQGGFIARDGSAVVRKDYKVLRVDVTGLPPMFGEPASRRADVAANVAITILGCWTGA